MNTQLFHQAANAVGLLAVCNTAIVPAQAEPVAIDWTFKHPIASENGGPMLFANVVNLSVRPQVDRLRHSFAQLRSLADGWSGENSVRPDADIVRAAARYLDQAMKGCVRAPAPAVVPMPDGGVQAEWYSPAARFEIYFEPNGEVLAWASDRASQVEHEAEGTEAIQLLVDWVARLDSEAISAA